METYDLAIVGGTVVDPAQDLREARTIAIKDGRVAAILDPLAPVTAARVIDAAGNLVLPGLVDLHTHTFPGYGKACDPDELCLRRGSTTVVDAGTTGWAAFPAFKRFVLDQSRTRMLAWLNLSSIGMLDQFAGELQNLQHVDPERAAQTALQHPDLVVGFKARSSASVCGGPFLPALRLLLDAAQRASLPVMVHIGDSVETLPQILDHLRPGDVITHIFTGRKNGLFNGGSAVPAAVLEARQRGVLFDCAHGRLSFSFEVAERAIELGFLPDTISTDIQINNVDPEHSLPLYMAKLLAIGLPLERMIPMVTSRPAALLNRTSEFGSLAPGMAADITVLSIQEQETIFQDTEERTRLGSHRLYPITVVRAGTVVEC